jgi:acetyl esterase/lipase
MLILTVLLGGCQATLMRSLSVPYALADVRVDKNVAFENAHGLTFDVYQPTTKPEPTTPRAMLVFFYGGSWRSGDKAWYRFIGKHYALQGYVVVIPNYRKSPQTLFPGFMLDAAAAYASARENAALYGSSPELAYIFGHSAGAHIGGLLVTDPQYLAAHGLKKSDVAGFIGLAGAYDFLPMTDPSVIETFGADANFIASQPIHFADGSEPRLLLIHGAKDQIVWPKNSRNLAAKVNDLGGSAEYLELSNTGHFSPLFQSARGFKRLAPEVDSAINGFVDP